MDTPVALLKFIAKASLNALGGGVAGDFAMEVLPKIAQDVWDWWGRDKNEAQRRADVQSLAAVSSTEMSKAVKQVVDEVAGDKPAEVQARLANFVHMVPGAVHMSLRRPDDPRGLTFPSNLPLQKAEDLLPFLPQRLPRFKPGDHPLLGVDRELVKLLGVGGFGEVWRARNPHVPNMPDVALKFCLDPASREQLLKHEAGVLNRVMSEGARPGIVQLRQTYLSAAAPCLEYEFIDGGDLASAIYGHQANKGPLTPEMASKIVLHLARAVAQVHKLTPPIVHRDLKPANVLVRKREGKTEFLITDFGIGGVVASQALEQTRSGGTSQPLMTALKGAHTPLYASPQQKKGDAADPRDDVHALGVIWYQLLIGDFSEGAPAGGAWRRELRQQGVSDKILDLIESCFEAKASHRPPDAAVVAEQIERIRKGSNDEVKPSPVEPSSTTVAVPPDTQPAEQGRVSSPVAGNRSSGAHAQDNSMSIAKQIIAAKTPGQKAAATRRLRTYVRQRATEGADPVMVEAGVKAAITRLNKKIPTPTPATPTPGPPPTKEQSHAFLRVAAGKLSAGQPLTAQDLADLPMHLGQMTLDEINHFRQTAGAGAGYKSTRPRHIATLVRYAQSKGVAPTGGAAPTSVPVPPPVVQPAAPSPPPPSPAPQP